MEKLMNMLDTPLVGFTILLLIILTIPPIFERIRLPGLVGLLVAGVVIGPDGLGLLSAEKETMKLLSEIGKIYLMFVAGLEIDLEDFRKTKNKSMGFGFATFIIPMIFGTVVGQMFGMGLNSSILVGSLLASHTLLAYPIVNRLGVVTNQAVTVTIGATIFTDIGALLVLAICISIHSGDFSVTSLIIQLSSLAIYSAIVLFGIDWAGKEYFRRTGDEESNQFLFVLLAVFLSAVGAQIIDIDKIVGAFLAGLAVNDVVGRNNPVEEKVLFVGSTLFIPFFFVDMGLLLSISGFVSTLTTDFWLTLAIVVGLISSKFFAAMVAKFLYRYSWDEGMTMWSLSLPQVAATLAATIAGVEAGLLTDSVFNAVIVLMLVTSIMGPIITAQFARKLSIPQAELSQNSDLDLNNSDFPKCDLCFTVVVPLYNPQSTRYLIGMGALLARHRLGKIVPLTITKAHVQMDDSNLNVALAQSDRLLQQALAISQEFQVEAIPQNRIDDDVAHGISRAAKEKNANLIIMGWSPTSTSLQARLFSNIIDKVFWSSHCPVAVMRLLDEPMNIHQILVPVKNITPQALRTVKFALLFADTNKAAVTLLHVSDRQTTKEELDNFESELSLFISQLQPQVDIAIKTSRSDAPAQVIIQNARSYDLIILRSMRRRTAGGLAVSDVTNQVIKEISCSMVLFGEPHSN